MITTGFFIGNRRLLSAQPFWRRWLVEFACWLAGWTCGDEIHGNTITFTRERAIELSSKPGFFKIELPLDIPLPEVPVQFGDNEDQFPLSDRTHIYHRGNDLSELRRGIENLTKKAASA